MADLVNLSNSLITVSPAAADSSRTADSQDVHNLNTRSTTRLGGGLGLNQNLNSNNPDTFNTSSSNLSELMFEIGQIAEQFGTSIAKMSSQNASETINAWLKQVQSGMTELLTEASNQYNTQIASVNANASAMGNKAIGETFGGAFNAVFSTLSGVQRLFGGNTNIGLSVASGVSGVATGSANSSSVANEATSGTDGAQATNDGQIFGVIDSTNQQALTVLTAVLQKIVELAATVAQGVSSTEGGANQQVS